MCVGLACSTLEGQDQARDSLNGKLYQRILLFADRKLRNLEFTYMKSKVKEYSVNFEVKYESKECHIHDTCS